MSDTIFGKRLKQLREEKKMNQKEFAKVLGVTPATLSTYEKSGKYPAVPKLIEMAKKADVSIDWLLGLSNTNAKEFDIKNYGEVFSIITALHNCSYLHIDVNGNYDPTDDCNYFSLTISDDHYGNSFLVSLLQKYVKIHKSYEENIIDKEFLDLWINTQLNSDVLNKPFEEVIQEEIEKERQQKNSIYYDSADDEDLPF